MAEYSYRLAIDCINHVRAMVHARDCASTFLLNRRQCEYLVQELLKISESLQARGAEISLEHSVQGTALLHLHATVKRAQLLVTRCFCENSAWLATAMALGHTKEEIVAILLGLRQWSLLMDIATICASSGPGSALPSAQVQELLETGEESYQRLSKQQSKMQMAIHDAARQDQEELLERIAHHSSVGAEGQGDEDFIRGVYLKAQLTNTKPENLQNVEGLKAHTFVGPLGSGASGMVMKVKWLGQEVALKILKEIARKEATLLGQVQHPNIVRLFHYWEDQSPRPHSRILMELMPGDLQQHIGNALGKRSASPRASGKGDSGGMPFSLPVAIDTMLQVAQAMRHVHEKKLTHRDLKTSNILAKPVPEEFMELHVEGYLEVKLADFGSSKAYTNSSISGGLTRNTGTTVYGAPEVFGKEEIARERNFPPKADVWSFGMTCSEIFTGRAPFADDIARSTLHKRIMKNGLRPHLPRDCPEYLRFCITSCWELEPQRRPSFRDLCRMLKHAKSLSLGLMDVESSKWLFAYQSYGGALKASVLSLQPQDDSRISRFGFETTWRNLLGAGVSSTSRNSSASGSHGQSQAVQSLSKLFRYKSNRQQLAFHKEFEQLDLKPNMFSYNVLRAATRDFHLKRKLGEHGFGAVYYGVMPSGDEVTVKLLRKRALYSNLHDEFVKEITLITRMNHRNLVNLKGCCLHEHHRLLVYEYVDNFDVGHILLDRGLSGSSEGQNVSWSQRVNICLGVARGLHYLHDLAFPKIIHRNIKARNILLDHNLEPKIADFSLALLCEDDNESEIVAGTVGYVAPEYLKDRQLSEKVDVFSFGVLCLEIISGRCCIESNRPDDQAYICNYAQRLHNEGRLMELIDSRLDLSGKGDVLRIIHISLLCVQEDPERRPTMARVVSMLQGDTEPQVPALLDAPCPVDLSPGSASSSQSWLESIEAHDDEVAGSSGPSHSFKSPEQWEMFD